MNNDDIKKNWPDIPVQTAGVPITITKDGFDFVNKSIVINLIIDKEKEIAHLKARLKQAEEIIEIYKEANDSISTNCGNSIYAFKHPAFVAQEAAKPVKGIK